MYVHSSLQIPVIFSVEITKHLGLQFYTFVLQSDRKPIKRKFLQIFQLLLNERKKLIKEKI